MGLNDVVGTTGPGPGGTKQTSVRSYSFYLGAAILGAGTYADNKNSLVDADGTNFTSHSIQLINDAASDIFFSFDGTNDHGRVKTGDPPLQQNFRREKTIWLRGTAGAAFRLSAW